MMFVEFTGMVGAGKSTLVPVLKEFLRDNNFEALSLGEAIIYHLERSLLGRLVYGIAPAAWRTRILYKIYSLGIDTFCRLQIAFENPRLVWQVCESQFHREIPLWHRQLILSLFFKILGGYQFLRHRLGPNQVVILEEGLIHRAINLYAWEPKQVDPDLVMTYFCLLPDLDLVVLVRAPFEICLERAEARGLPLPLRDKDEPTVDRFMDHSAQIISIASEFLASTDRQVVEVDNGGKLEDGIADLCKGLGSSHLLVTKPETGSSEQPSWEVA
jgi:hypothetical protein